MCCLSHLTTLSELSATGVGGGSVDVVEDAVKHGARSSTSRAISSSISPSISERNRSFSSPSTMNREKCTVPSASCAFARSGVNPASSSGNAFAMAAPPNWEVNDEMTLAHNILLGCQNRHVGFSECWTA